MSSNLFIYCSSGLGLVNSECFSQFDGTDSHFHVELGGCQSDEARGVIRGRLRLTR